MDQSTRRTWALVRSWSQSLQRPCRSSTSKTAENSRSTGHSSPSADRYSVAGLNENDGLELCLSDPEVSDPYEVDPHIQWIFPLLVGGNQCRHDPALNALDPRMGGPICVQDARIRFFAYIGAGETPSEVDCVRFFVHQYLISHTNLTILEEKSTFTEPEMNRGIGIMFAMTISPISSIEDFWKEEYDVLMTDHNFGSKFNLGRTRFKCIRKHFRTGAAPAEAKTFDGFRPIRNFFYRKSSTDIAN